MLAIDAGSVDMRLARPAPNRIVRGLLNRTDPLAPNYSPDGVNGDPGRATHAKGEQLLDAMLRDVIGAIESVTRGKPHLPED
jgi:creatinine amidohydrolase/Fe(II)-dependent formamide hydrolase-like protein